MLLIITCAVKLVNRLIKLGKGGLKFHPKKFMISEILFYFNLELSN